MLVYVYPLTLVMGNGARAFRIDRASAISIPSRQRDSAF